jgi:hypothetical protein
VDAQHAWVFTHQAFTCSFGNLHFRKGIGNQGWKKCRGPELSVSCHHFGNRLWRGRLIKKDISAAINL